MQTYEILVKNRAILANSPDMTLVRTSVGIDQMHVLFDNEEWLGFPITVTFSQGEDSITQSLTISEVDDSDWVAQATCLIPHEVIDMVGPIRVTLQGTDSDGNHIITAAAAPLSVEESGDTEAGDAPSEAPTVDEWNQAYANAIAAANAAQSVADNLSARIESIVSDAELYIQSTVDNLMVPATTESLGVVMVGDGIDVDEDGVISATSQPSTQPSQDGMTDEDRSALTNLQLLAEYAFITEFDNNGVLKDTVRVKPKTLPIADLDTLGTMYPDGTTVKADADGMLHASYVAHSWDGTVLTMHTLEGSSSADLIGPRGPAGPTGPQGPEGPQGPSGYVLTPEDIETISEAIVEQFMLGDTTRY